LLKLVIMPLILKQTNQIGLFQNLEIYFASWISHML
ncbi:hypothetical protein T05_7444, partial [Trichinella murrelli]